MRHRPFTVRLCHNQTEAFAARLGLLAKRLRRLAQACGPDRLDAAEQRRAVRLLLARASRQLRAFLAMNGHVEDRRSEQP